MRFPLSRCALAVLSSLLAPLALAEPQEAGFTAATGNFFKEAEYTLGAGVAYGPNYAGSDDYDVGPALNFRMVSPTGFYLDLQEGLGWQTQLDNGFSFGLGLGYDGGRAESDEDLGSGSDRLKGMGDVDGSLLATAMVGYAITPSTVVSVSFDQALTNTERGLTWSVQLGHEFELSESDSIGLGAGVHLGNAKYNQTYFGVTDAQSRTSRFKAYKAESGINSYSFGVSWTHRFNKTWSTELAAGAVRYAGEAEDSPLVEEKTNYQAALLLNYSF
ncbi:MipA/OmpV family protein [Chitiniphilus purpureus]|uniref:MipA/OmpV family protein n=1 Tax=Chitiniphilus purpureus TaxID=2981137 RepID=A0ABY6DRB8_9NEIS|nr:MipA/OmpV family protein [Chitiniphilus sp. CD1]UXY16906.1 MipA/OmpV family protein [Chitiniphilus sp. CD1]